VAVPELSAETLERAGRVRLILLDVDGVLTDGRIHMTSDGSEGRSFYVRDGLGIRLAQMAGLEFGILSGRESGVVVQRAAELRITEVHQRVLQKAERFREIVERRAIPPEEVCFIGDDLIDVPAMRLAGFAAAPADAAPETREAAHYVTEADGGRGAVREVVDLVLRASGMWEGVLQRCFNA
jgi:3-deoxy-D-manno-octulosonate 8-phosphate phosphatase (KDO 8-P phosphatase)